MQGNSSDHEHISVDDNVLTLKATPVSGQPPSTAAPYPDIHYISGTIYAKEQVNVDGTDAVGYVVEGEFRPSTEFGTWPAFWLTAVVGWPPEADIGEWKGTHTLLSISMNAGQTSDSHPFVAFRDPAGLVQHLPHVHRCQQYDRRLAH